MKKEAIIQKYFDMWVSGNFDNLDLLFDKNIYYSECYGPEYQGMDEIWQWIDKMRARQIVHKWNIKRFIHQGDTVVVEWFFEDEIKNERHEFDGVSIVEFEGNKITSIKEFESVSKHTTPFRFK